MVQQAKLAYIVIISHSWNHMNGSITATSNHTAFTIPKAWRRIGIALLVAIVLHILFVFGLAPHLAMQDERIQPTEVVQISQEQLNQLKKKMRAKPAMNPLLKQELREQFKSKEAPKDAQMIAPFNQVVPKQTVAGPQADQPLEGGGGRPARPQSQPRQKPRSETKPQPKLSLSSLGLARKPLPPPLKSSEIAEQQSRESAMSGPQGPPGPHRPMGRDAKDIERGQDNMLNAVESEFYSFFSRLNDPIIRNWYFLVRSNEASIYGEMAASRVKQGMELPVTIELVIDRQGNFQDVRVAQSSGLPVFDRLTSDAVKKVGSAPNPPAALFEGGQYYSRMMTFVLIVNDAPISSARPDIYW